MAIGSQADFRRLLAAAEQHQRAGRLAEAEAACAEAATIAPGHPVLALAQGVTSAAWGDHAAALAHFERALAREPAYAAAHYNRGVALEALGRNEDALVSLERAAALEPGHYDVHRALGFLWLARGNRGRALDHFGRTYELRRGEDRSLMALASLTTATRAKLAHDAEQWRYLATRKRDGKRFELMARAYDLVAEGVGDRARKLTEAELETLGESYNTSINVAGAPELGGSALGAFDRAAVVREWESSGGAVTIDRLLSQPALTSLRRYLLESTIWHDFTHIGAFVASYLEDGLACPLVLQVIDELRGALPEILGPHPLSQAWAFKGLAGSAAVAAHADDAAVSINLWMTPDAANLAPGTGGLEVCLVPPPADWQMRDYDADEADVATFLDQHSAESLHVPYAENRAVLFRSRLFHRSDAPRFADGYENHRINLTLLFGHHC